MSAEGCASALEAFKLTRAIWSGALAFGLVNIPVKLLTAVTQKEVRFHMLHGTDGARIRMKRFCSAEDREIPFEEIVKGFEVEKERYVAITEDELAALDPKATRTIEIKDFVDLDQIDPIYFESTYYLVPERTSAKAYRLLVEAMRRSGKVAIATFVLRTREALCCVRPVEDVLALSTMNRADEVVPISALDFPRGEEAADREIEMAEQLVRSLSSPFEPQRYPDVHREQVVALIEKKGAGQLIEAPPPEAGQAQVVSLVDALSASLDAARRRAEGAARSPAPQEAPSRGERRHPPAAAARTARGAGKKRA